MIIREYKNGKFQIWDEDHMPSKVLDPIGLTWLGESYCYLDYTYINNLAKARSLAKEMKEKGIVVKEHYIEEY